MARGSARDRTVKVRAVEGRTSERAREGGCPRAPAAPGPRRRAVGARRDAAVGGGGRRGHRGAQGRGLLSRRARRDLRGDARPLPAVGARRPGLGLRPPRPARLARRRSAAARPCSRWPRPCRSSRTRGATPTSCARWRMLRGLIRVGTEVAQLGYDRPGDTRELLDMAEQKVYEIAQNGTTEDFTLIKQPLDEAFHRLTLLFEHGDGSGVTGLPTGFGELDRLTSGLQKSNLVILAARPVDGQDEPRAQHRRARRGDAAEAGRAVLARDVQGRDRPAPAVLGRQGRPEPAEAGPARGRRLDARHGRDGDARQRAALHRRLGRDDGDGDARQGAPAVGAPAGRARRWSSSTTSS